MKTSLDRSILTLFAAVSCSTRVFAQSTQPSDLSVEHDAAQFLRDIWTGRTDFVASGMKFADESARVDALRALLTSSKSATSDDAILVRSLDAINASLKDADSGVRQIGAAMKIDTSDLTEENLNRLSPELRQEFMEAFLKSSIPNALRSIMATVNDQALRKALAARWKEDFVQNFTIEMTKLKDSEDAQAITMRKAGEGASAVRDMRAATQKDRDRLIALRRDVSKAQVSSDAVALLFEQHELAEKKSIAETRALALRKRREESQSAAEPSSPRATDSIAGESRANVDEPTNAATSSNAAVPASAKRDILIGLGQRIVLNDQHFYYELYSNGKLVKSADNLIPGYRCTIDYAAGDVLTAKITMVDGAKQSLIFAGKSAVDNGKIISIECLP